MAIKKICALTVAGALLLGCLGVWADEDYQELGETETADAVFAEDTAAAMPEDIAVALAEENAEFYTIKEFASDEDLSSNGTAGFISNTANNRLFNQNARMTWNTGGKTSTVYKANTAEKKLPTGEYSYINAWIYNPEVKRYNGGAVSQMTWLLRTGNSATDLTGTSQYYRYKLTMDWEGWKLVSVPLSKFSANVSGISFSYGVYAVALAANEWTADTTRWDGNGNYIDIDMMWLSKEASPTAFNLTNVSVENGAGYVPSDLDGSRTFTMTFGQPLRDSVPQDAITVTRDGELLSRGYSVETADSEIRVIFDEALDAGSTYIIELGTNIFDIYGNSLTEGRETVFTVEAPSTLFKVTESEFANGAVDVPVDLDGSRTYTLVFNNPVESAEIMQNITVFQNGLKLYGGYSVTAEENSVQIIMEQDLQPGTLYAIRLENGFKDQFRNALIGDNEFSFTTAQKAPDTWEVISFDSDEKLSQLVGLAASAIYLTDENTRMFDKTLRIDIPVSPTDRTARGRATPIDATPYRYVNYWMYSPKVTPYKLNAVIYTSDGNNSYFLATIAVDWVGWKLVSVPKSSFKAYASATWENMNGFSVNANGWLTATSGSWQEEGYILLDQIYFSVDEPSDFAYVGSNFPDGYRGMPIFDGEAELTYTNQLSPVQADAVSLKKNGQPVDIPLEIKTEGNCLKIRIDGELEYDTAYSIEVSNGIYDSSGQQVSGSAVCSFVTESAGLSAGKPVFKSESGTELTELPTIGSNLTVACKVKNQAQNAEPAILAVGQYDSSGSLIDWKTESQSVAAGAEANLTVIMERKPETVAIRAFAMNTARELLRQDYSLLGAEAAVARRVYGKAAAADSGLTLEGTELNIYELKLKGISKGWEAVLAEVKNDQGEVVLITPVYPDAEGVYIYPCIFSEELESGMYTVRTSTAGAKPAEMQLKYYDKSDRDEQLALVNTSDSVKEIAVMLRDGASVFGLQGLNEVKIECIAQTLIEQRTYKTYNDFLDKVTEIRAVLEELNVTKWSGLPVFLKNNHNIVLGESPAYTYYSGLSVKNQNVINQAVAEGMPVDSFVEFRTLFNKVVEQYKAGELSSGSDYSGRGGGGSGSSSGGGTTMGFSKDMVSQYVPDISTAGNSEEPFADLESSAWAKDSIAQLYKLGIISPSEDKKFRPEDSVTREEFVKLLVMAFGVELKSESSNFSDAKDGEWYQPYLAAAKSSGMINGNPDGTFGVGQPITRQDMATMAYRTASSFGKTLKQTKEFILFADESEIGPYAVEAVKTMQRAGVLNGMGDNKFRPLEQSSRAQAAKVIAELLHAVE